MNGNLLKKGIKHGRKILINDLKFKEKELREIKDSNENSQNLIFGVFYGLFLGFLEIYLLIFYMIYGFSNLKVLIKF